MIYLLLDCHLDLGLRARRRISVATYLASLFVVTFGLGMGFLGKLDIHDLEVILNAIRGMGPNEQAVDGVVFARRPVGTLVYLERTRIEVQVLFHIWEPLGGQGWPLESGGENHVVEKGTRRTLVVG